MNDYNLLVETKEYLQQSEVKWSINTSHIKVLFELYLNVLDDISHRLTLLKVFQVVSINQDIAELVAKNSRLGNDFIDKLKQSSEPDIKYHSLQMVSIRYRVLIKMRLNIFFLI